jgi:type IV secretory pathway TrbL component
LHVSAWFSRLAKEDETPEEDRIVVDRPAKRTAEEEERVAKAVNHTKTAMEAAFKVHGGGSGNRASVVGEEGEEFGGAKTTAKDFGRAMHEQMMERRRDLGDGGTIQKDWSGEGSGAKVHGPSKAVEGCDDDEGDDIQDGDVTEEEGKAGGRPKTSRDERNEQVEALKRENQRKGIGRLKAPDQVRVF